MKVQTNINMSIGVRRKRVETLDVELTSYDKNNHEFEISFIERDLTSSDEVKIFSVFDRTKRTDLSDAEIRNGKAYFVFDTDLVEGLETVTSYVHLKAPDMQAEIDAFRFHVDMSGVDIHDRIIAEVYDQRFDMLLAEFELKINEHLLDLDDVEENEKAREIQESIRVKNENERKSNYSELVETGVVQAGIDEKLAEHEETYAPRLTDLEKNDENLTAQLAHTENLASEAYGKTWSLRKVSDSEPPAFITVVDDDAGVEVLTKLKPIADELGITFTVAAIVDFQTENPPNQLSIAQLKDLQNSGWEIASHSVTHTDLSNLSEDELDYEMWYSKQYFRSHGLDIKNFVAPYGTNVSSNVRKAASKYYNCTPGVGGGINTFPVRNHLLNRVALGSYTPDGENTLEYYKSQVDDAIEKGGWLIFMTHALSPDHDETQNLYLKQTLEYALSKNVSVVNLQEGYEKFGNMVEVEHQLALGNNGKFVSPSVTHVFSQPKEITKDTPPIYFDQNYNEKVVTSKTWVELSPGVYNYDGYLITYVIGAAAEFVQIYYPYREEKILKRHTTGDGSTASWTDWVVFEPDAGFIINNRERSSHSYKNDTPLSLFPAEKITYSKISAGSDSGFPADAGLLMTNRLGNENGYDFQEFTTYTTGNKYYRGTNVAGSWLAWKQITMV